ncbi:hypothetical protein AK812_SmicGene20602 [Symbiodinium microadriaticum]|uniref:Uncharacterized protein n=1 Tax=Symbiodinium microadriaticum TaxID=2951 RepID=A0A1Q9DPI3_SYMMI|nr:hypothetical protein AK812_SmicGene20602 [Symbiodinium microadriaticum]
MGTEQNMVAQEAPPRWSRLLRDLSKTSAGEKNEVQAKGPPPRELPQFRPSDAPTTEKEERLELHFFHLSLGKVDPEAFKTELMLALLGIGFPQELLASLAVGLRAGSVIAEIRGPASSMQKLKSLPVYSIHVMGCQAQSAASAAAMAANAGVLPPRLPASNESDKDIPGADCMGKAESTAVGSAAPVSETPITAVTSSPCAQLPLLAEHSQRGTSAESRTPLLSGTPNRDAIFSPDRRSRPTGFRSQAALPTERRKRLPSGVHAMPAAPLSSEEHRALVGLPDRGRRVVGLTKHSTVDEIIYGLDFDRSGSDPHREYMKQFADFAGVPSGHKQGPDNKKKRRAVLNYCSQLTHHVDEKSPHEEFMQRFSDRAGARNVENRSRPFRAPGLAHVSTMGEVIHGRSPAESPRGQRIKSFSAAGCKSVPELAHPEGKSMVSATWTTGTMSGGTYKDASPFVKESDQRFADYAGKKVNLDEKPAKKCSIRGISVVDKLVYGRDISQLAEDPVVEYAKKHAGYAGFMWKTPGPSPEKEESEASENFTTPTNAQVVEEHQEAREGQEPMETFKFEPAARESAENPPFEPATLRPEELDAAGASPSPSPSVKKRVNPFREKGSPVASRGTSRTPSVCSSSGAGPQRLRARDRWNVEELRICDIMSRSLGWTGSQLDLDENDVAEVLTELYGEELELDAVPWTFQLASRGETRCTSTSDLHYALRAHHMCHFLPQATMRTLATTNVSSRGCVDRELLRDLMEELNGGYTVLAAQVNAVLDEAEALAACGSGSGRASLVRAISAWYLNVLRTESPWATTFRACYGRWVPEKGYHWEVFARFRVSLTEAEEAFHEDVWQAVWGLIQSAILLLALVFPIMFFAWLVVLGAEHGDDRCPKDLDGLMTWFGMLGLALIVVGFVDGRLAQEDVVKTSYIGLALSLVLLVLPWIGAFWTFHLDSTDQQTCGLFLTGASSLLWTVCLVSELILGFAFLWHLAVYQEYELTLQQGHGLEQRPSTFGNRQDTAYASRSSEP